jgi:hypothetical protein
MFLCLCRRDDVTFPLNPFDQIEQVMQMPKIIPAVSAVPEFVKPTKISVDQARNQPVGLSVLGDADSPN